MGGPVPFEPPEKPGVSALQEVAWSAATSRLRSTTSGQCIHIDSMRSCRSLFPSVFPYDCGLLHASSIGILGSPVFNSLSFSSAEQICIFLNCIRSCCVWHPLKRPLRKLRMHFYRFFLIEAALWSAAAAATSSSRTATRSFAPTGTASAPCASVSSLWAAQICKNSLPSPPRTAVRARGRSSSLRCNFRRGSLKSLSSPEYTESGT